MTEVQRITPFLWMDGVSHEAAEFYVSVFDDAAIVAIDVYEDGPAQGSAVATFELFGQRFIAFDGHPAIDFTPAISFMVTCDTQDEIDRYWERLCDGGTEVQCGWLEDKFGVSWQIIPTGLPEMLNGGPNSNRVMEAMLPMKKLDIKLLEAAHRGG